MKCLCGCFLPAFTMMCAIYGNMTYDSKCDQFQIFTKKTTTGAKNFIEFLIGSLFEYQCMRQNEHLQCNEMHSALEVL